MRIPITRYGQPHVSIMAVGGLAAAAVCAVFVHWAVGLAVAVATVAVLAFFRDPARVAPEGERLLVAPADGRVVEVADVTEPEFIGGPAKRISIFLSLFSVHVNRSPARARVAWSRHVPGRFLAAFRKESSTENERNMIGLEDAEGTGARLVVIQIAGVVARRIVSRAEPGTELERGEPFGMIKFGSRTELYIPAGRVREIKVAVGDKVFAGRDVVGVLR